MDQLIKSVKKFVNWIRRRPYSTGAILSLLAASCLAVLSFSLEPVYMAIGSGGVRAAICKNLLGLIFGAGGFLFFAWFGLRIVGRQQTATATHARETASSPNQRILSRKALIMGFSSFNSPNRPEAEVRSCMSKQQKDEAKKAAKVLPGEDGFDYLGDDGKPLLEIEDAVAKGCSDGNKLFGNWQQVLRLIQRLNHSPRRLELVQILIGDQGVIYRRPDENANEHADKSEPNDPALQQGTRLIEILRAYFPDIEFEYVRGQGNKRFLLEGYEGINSYFNFDFVREGFEAAHKALARKLGLSVFNAESEIYIDITGGMAVLSVAAATYSMNRDFRIVYVGSGTSNSHELHGFNLTLQLGSYFTGV